MDQAYLHYEFLPGSIELSDEISVIQLDWKKIPLLDFSLCFSNILQLLKADETGKEVFEFSTSDNVIEILRNYDEISISTDFSSTILRMSMDAFEEGVKSFHARLSEFIRQQLPAAQKGALDGYLAE